MTWQDWCLAAQNAVFCVSLLPTLIRGPAPPLGTSVTTGLALVAGSVVFATLGLWAGAVVEFIVACQWFFLAGIRKAGG